jgi:hypothetical protein
MWGTFRAKDKIDIDLCFKNVFLVNKKLLDGGKSFS